MCSYLRPRNGGVYYTRMVVPPRLRPIIGKSDLGRSLGTKDRAEAKRLLPAWLEEAQSTIAAAERELARMQAGPAAANGPLTQGQADWEAENDRFWREVEWEDEVKAKADVAIEARLQRPEAELTTNEAGAARLLREARQERDRYRNRYHVRKRRDADNGPRQASASQSFGSGPWQVRLSLSQECLRATLRRRGAGALRSNSSGRLSVTLSASLVTMMRKPWGCRT